MKRVFMMMLLFLIALGSYAGDKVRGELRTEINGFQWYCYRNIEAYSIDGRRLFTDIIEKDKVYKIKKIFNISFLTADKSDKGIFVIDCESKAYDKIVCDCNGKLIVGIGNRSDEFHRIKEVFSNNHTKYFIRQYRRPKQYWLFSDDGKCLFYSYESYSIAGDMFLVKEYDDELYKIVKSDGKVLADYLHSVEYMKASNQILVSYKKDYSRVYAIIDVRTEKSIIKNATNIKYEDDVIKIEKDGGKGLMSYNGKWIVNPDLGYTVFETMYNGSTKCYKIGKNGRYGLTNSDGKEILPCEMEALESAGNGYLKYKLNGFWGVMNYTGKIIIDTDRGYTSIGDFKTFNKRFAYTMTGYKGECDATGRQISKIKVETPKRNTSVASSSSSSGSSSSSSSSSSNSSSGGTTTIVVEHQHTPQPFQEWQQCTSCWGSGNCRNCAGSGTNFIGSSLKRCSMCGGRGKCTTCSGQGGRYITVYK